jgi:3-deoxy-D-manno-octulosonic-acid transferase
LPDKTGRKRIWIQAVSVGELLAIGPLLRIIGKEENWEVVLSTTTSTGYRVAQSKYGQTALAIGHFPLDFLPCSRRAWNRIKPDLVIMVDSELWPEHLHQARNRDIPVAIVNARLSDRSAKRLRNSNWIRKLIVPSRLTVLASSKIDAEKWLKIGVDSENLKTTGNLKFDHAPDKILDETEKEALLIELGLKVSSNEPNPIVLFGASTWPGEEDCLLQFLEDKNAQKVPLRLVLVPRHAERGDDIAALLRKRSMPWFRRSTKTGEGGEKAKVCLADTTGELSQLMQVSDVVFVGKTMPPNQGGQNPVEAASFGIPLVFGPNTQNFSEMFETLTDSGGGIRVANGEQLDQELSNLLHDDARRKSMGNSARAWKTEQEGATEQTYSVLRGLLKSQS